MDGRVPNYLGEDAIVAELLARAKAGKRDMREGRPIFVRSPQTTPPPGMINSWEPHEFPYPSRIQFIEERADGGMRGVVLAMPYEQHDSFDFGAVQAIRSRNGRLWIPFPGVWYLTYSPADPASIDTGIFGVVFDDTCGATADLSKIKHTGIETDVITVGAGAAVNLAIGEHTPQLCDGVVIQNIGAVDLWVEFGRAADRPAAVGAGLVVPPRGSLELVGDLTYPWPVNGIADGANCGVFLMKLVS